jgi:hypothetical protein
MDPAVWKQLLVLFVPLIGKGLKMIPVVNNQVIPWILVIFLTAKNYWIMADLPIELIPTETVDASSPEVMLAWIGTIGTHFLALGWGVLEGYIATRFHKSYKYRDRYKRAITDGYLDGKAQREAKKADRWIV